MTTPEKYIYYEHGDHLLFTGELTYGMVDRLVMAIEKGAPDRSYSSREAFTLR